MALSDLDETYRDDRPEAPDDVLGGHSVMFYFCKIVIVEVRDSKLIGIVFGGPIEHDLSD